MPCALPCAILFFLLLFFFLLLSLRNMDAEKLWRCQQFFLQGLLKDRQYTYPVRAYQTNRDQFDQMYMLTRNMPGFLEYLRIEGTFVPNQSMRRAKRSRPSPIPQVQGQVQGGGGGKGTAAQESAAGGGGGKGTAAPEPAAGGDGDGSSAAPGIAPSSRRAPQKFLVHFAPTMSDTTYGKQQATALIQYVQEQGITRLFLVTATSVTPQAHKVLVAGVASIEYWPMLECLSEAEHHYTVPACRRLSVREKKAFYAKHNLTHSNMSRMLMSERVAKYHDLQPGDLVCINRQTHVGLVKGEMRVVVQA
jgi:DNA-directed RNA polymerase subunit H (RpoH/RPB5)